MDKADPTRLLMGVLPVRQPVAAAPTLPASATPKANLDASRSPAHVVRTLATSIATVVATAPVGTDVNAGCSG